MNTQPPVDRRALSIRLQGILAARALDLGLARQIKELSSEQRSAIVEWQRTARVYELIQQIARRRLALENLTSGAATVVRRTMLNLDLAIEQSALPADLVLYRGIRSLQDTFGTQHATALRGRAHEDLGYMAVSVHAEVARRDFTTPKGALLSILVPKGSPALWVARAGDSNLSWQGEVLLGSDTTIQFHHVEKRTDLPLVFGEVMT